MTKVAIKKIGFIEQNEVNDQWVQQEEEPAQRSVPDIYLDGSHWFRSIDQGNASLNEQSEMGTEGKVFKQDLQFTVRTEYDIALARKYLNRPLVLHVWTVDGKRHVIGTKIYPVYLQSDNRYDGTNTREMAISCTYEATASQMK